MRFQAFYQFLACVFSLVAFALVGLVIDLPLTQPDDATRPGFARDITPEQLFNLSLFAEYTAATYCNSHNIPGQLISCRPSNTCPLVEANEAFTSLAFETPIFDTRGFIAIDLANSFVVVSLRGASSIRNWIIDLTFIHVPCDLVAGCFVHGGFLAAWAEVSPTVLAGVSAARAAHPTFPVVVTGHSHGAGLATLAAAYLRLAGHHTDLYTYGSPRVGNTAFAAYITGSQPGNNYRVTHANDPITKVPPPLSVLDYAHISPEYWIDANENDVPAEDIRICTGYKPLGCSAGTSGFNITAHLWYFGNTCGCSDQASLPF